MYFREIGNNRFQVFKNKKDDRFTGIIEKHEYASINMATGKRVVKRFWTAYGRGEGWRNSSKQHFDTREEAGAYIIKDAKIPYNQKKMHWTKRQGESAALKEAKGSK